MKKILVTLCLGLMLAGCQQKPSSEQENMTTERQEAAKKLFAQSVILLHQKDLKGAVASLEASIKVDPTDPNPYLVLGQILLKANEFDHAVDFLDGAVKVFPENGTIFYMLSVANRMDKKPLPAVLAARKSFDIFKAAGDMTNAQASAILLEELIKEAQAQEAAQAKTPQGKPEQKEATPSKE